MYRGQWNGLRVGDLVAVHDSSDAPAYPLMNGAVAFVDTTSRSHGVGVRIQADATRPTRIIWPARLAVHVDSHDATAACRWCAA